MMTTMNTLPLTWHVVLRLQGHVTMKKTDKKRLIFMTLLFYHLKIVFVVSFV